nr:type II toxin-antitoxin system HicA family toxin [Robbsia betulipollinis]
MRRWIARQGATFSEGARHAKIYLNERQSVMPRHPGTEIGEGLKKMILKQLGLK